MSGLKGYDQWKTASPYDDEPDCVEVSEELEAKAIGKVRATKEKIASQNYLGLDGVVGELLDLIEDLVDANKALRNAI
jgi:hypothetical protein